MTGPLESGIGWDGVRGRCSQSGWISGLVDKSGIRTGMSDEKAGDHSEEGGEVDCQGAGDEEGQAWSEALWASW